MAEIIDFLCNGKRHLTGFRLHRNLVVEPIWRPGTGHPDIAGFTRRASAALARLEARHREAMTAERRDA